MPKGLSKFKNREAMLAYRNKQRKTNYDKSKANAKRKYIPWTEYEYKLILEHKITDFELSKQIGRSVQAIQEQRTRLKKGKTKVKIYELQ